MHYNLAAAMSWPLNNEFGVEKFQTAVNSCQEAIAQLVPKLESSQEIRQQAYRRILQYVDLQLSRASQWFSAEVDLLAVVCRALVDCLAWASYISQGDTELHSFLEEQTVDLKDLYRKIQSAFPAFFPGQIGSTSRRVEPPRDKGAGDVLFKLCSKYIHPSSYLLNGLDERLSDNTVRVMLGRFTVLYSWAILEALGFLTVEPQIKAVQAIPKTVLPL